MKIVVLDGYTLNPGDLSWRQLEAFGKTTVYDRTPPEQLVERVIDADIILSNKTPLPAKVIAQLPALRYIGVLATGYNNVDVVEASRRGIVVTNVPDYGPGSVAQFVFALLLELCNRVRLHSDAVHTGEWSASPDFCFSRSPLVELQGKTIGIVGFGNIGKRTAKIAAAFGMNVLTLDRGKRPGIPFDMQYVTLPALLAESDVISLHCPLTPETNGLINKETLARMKPSALLINTSRGGLIVEQDLANALNQGQIGGAGLDVLSVEPPNPDNPLLTAVNCVITPHIAWATKEARARLLEMAVDNLQAFLSGSAVNAVN